MSRQPLSSRQKVVAWLFIGIGAWMWYQADHTAWVPQLIGIASMLYFSTFLVLGRRPWASVTTKPVPLAISEPAPETADTEQQQHVYQGMFFTLTLLEDRLTVWSSWSVDILLGGKQELQLPYDKIGEVRFVEPAGSATSLLHAVAYAFGDQTASAAAVSQMGILQVVPLGQDLPVPSYTNDPQLRTPHTIEFKKEHVGAFREAARIIREHMSAAKAQHVPDRGSATLGEQLRELKRLVDEGIVSHDEFARKKQQLLGL